MNQKKIGISRFEPLLESNSFTMHKMDSLKFDEKEDMFHSFDIEVLDQSGIKCDTHCKSCLISLIYSLNNLYVIVI